MSANSYARFPGMGEVGPIYHTPTYSIDDAYAAVAEALVKSDDVHELVQDVAEAHAFLCWAGDSGLVPQQFKNAAMLLRMQAKKLAGDADKWGTENAT